MRAPRISKRHPTTSRTGLGHSTHAHASAFRRNGVGGVTQCTSTPSSPDFRWGLLSTKQEARRASTSRDAMAVYSVRGHPSTSGDAGVAPGEGRGWQGAKKKRRSGLSGRLLPWLGRHARAHNEQGERAPRLGALSGLLARRQDDCVRLARRDHQSLGCRYLNRRNSST